MEPSWSAEREELTSDVITNVFIDRLVAAYLWLLLTPFIIMAAEFIARRNFSVWVTGAIHLFTALFFTFIHLPLYTSYVFAVHAVVPWMYAGVFEKIPDIGYIDYVVSAITRLNHVYRLLYYSIIIAIHFAFDYFRKYTDRAVRTSQLELQLKEAQIRTLHQQLQPHFLFNTLNGISSLMYKNVEEADKMLTYLGDLLRISLERMNVQEVPLRDDIAFIERYLKIEKTRMGKRLSITMDFAPDTLDAMVPVMLTQPLLENAVKHGIASRSTKGTIAISSRRHNDALHLQVEDSGPGFTAPAEEYYKNGYGLRNTMERLKLLYGNASSVTFGTSDSGNFCVTLVIPFRIQTK